MKMITRDQLLAAMKEATLAYDRRLGREERVWREGQGHSEDWHSSADMWLGGYPDDDEPIFIDEALSLVIEWLGCLDDTDYSWYSVVAQNAINNTEKS